MHVAHLFEVEAVGQRARQTGVVRLNVQTFDDAIVDDHGIALWAESAQRWQIDSQIHGLGEHGIWIGEHTDFSIYGKMSKKND